MNQIINIKKELRSKANSAKAKILQGFFKTGKGQYGEGDIFLGIIVPEQRKIAKKYIDLDLKQIQELLKSKIHEERLTSLLILVTKYKKAEKLKDEKQKQEIFKFYLENTKTINNWDLVDLSAPTIVGNYLLNKDKKILYKLANSDNLWEKRIAIVSTFGLIKNNQLEETIKIAEILLKDKHDLIHKAVGWALREIGKRDLKELEEFLNTHHKNMPRTMLRYAIEKFDDDKRKRYLEK